MCADNLCFVFLRWGPAPLLQLFSCVDEILRCLRWLNIIPAIYCAVWRRWAAVNIRLAACARLSVDGVTVCGGRGGLSLLLLLPLSFSRYSMYVDQVGA